MSTAQAIFFGMMLALTPSLALLAFMLWRDNRPPAPLYQNQTVTDYLDEITGHLIVCTEHIHDPPDSPRDLAARLRLLAVARMLLCSAGFQVVMVDRAPFFDQREGEAPSLAP